MLVFFPESYWNLINSQTRKTYNSNFHTCKHTLRMIVIYTVEEIRMVYCSLRTPGPFHCYDKLIVHINYRFWSFGQSNVTYSITVILRVRRKNKTSTVSVWSNVHKTCIYTTCLTPLGVQIWKRIKSLNKSIYVLTKCISQLPVTIAQVKYHVWAFRPHVYLGEVGRAAFRSCDAKAYEWNQYHWSSVKMWCSVSTGRPSNEENTAVS